MINLPLLSLGVLLVPVLVLAAEPSPLPRTDGHGDPLPPGAVARYGSARLVHADFKQIAFAPGGKLLASRSGEELRVWDLKTGELLWKLPSRGPFAFTPEALVVAEDNELRLLEAATGKVLRTLDRRDAPAHAYDVVVSGDGRTAVVCWSAKGVMVYDLAVGGETKPRRLCGDDLEYLCLSATEHRLAGLKGEEIQVWDVSAGELLRTIKLPFQRERGEGLLALSADGTLVASLDPDALKVHVWLTGTGRAPKGFNAPKADVSQLRFAADGKTLLGVESGGLVIWSAETGKVEARHGNTAPWESRAVADDGVTLAGNEYAMCRIHVWDARTGKERVASDPLLRRPTNEGPGPWSVGFIQPDLIAAWIGKEWCFVGAHDGKVKVRNRVADRSAALSPDGKYLATESVGSAAEEAVISQLVSGKVVSRLPIHGGVSHFSPDGKLLLAWHRPPEMPEGRAKQVSYQLWEVATGRLVRTVSAPGDASRPAISPDGRTVVYCDKEIAFIEVSTGKVRERLKAPVEPPEEDWRQPSGKPEDAQFSCDGRTLLVNRGRDLFVIDCKSGRLVFQHRTTWDCTTRAVLAPDGRWLATTDGSAVEVRDLRDPRPHRFEGHEGEVHSLSFAPDGRLLVSAGSDGTAVVWDMRPLIEAAAKRPSPDERRLAA